MEPVFMVLGQSAATAAVQAIEQGVNVQDIDPARLQARLLADGQVLDFESPPITPVTRKPRSNLPGIVVDDLDAERRGFDRGSSAHPVYVDAGYHHDNNANKGGESARFTPDLPTAGRYQVRIAYPHNANRATNVPVVIRHADGETRLMLNQRRKPALEDLFEPVGEFRFEAGRGGHVEIANAGTDGYVVIDAVQWLPAGRGK